MQCPNCSALCFVSDRVCASCRQRLPRTGNRGKIVTFTSMAFACVGVAVMSVIHFQHSKGGPDIAGSLTVGLFAAGFAAVGVVVGHVIAFVIRA
jgi:hypothetical protein